MRTLLVAVFVVSAGCAGAKVPPAVVSPQPDVADVQQIRAHAIRAMDVVAASAGIANSVGATLNGLPVSNDLKDMYDCALLRAVGTPEPASATVISVCGFTPSLSKEAPLARALTELAGVTTCPSLQTTISRALLGLEPLLSLIEGSTQPLVRMVGATMRALTAPLKALIGSPTCSA